MLTERHAVGHKHRIIPWVVGCNKLSQKDSKRYGADNLSWCRYSRDKLSVDLEVMETKMHHLDHLDCLLGLYWTGLSLLNGFPFLVYFFLFILGRAVD